MYLEGEEKKSLKARSWRALCERSGLVSSSGVTPARCPRARRSTATSVQARCERGDGCAKEPLAGGSWWGGEKRQGRQGGEIGRRDESPGLLGVGMLPEQRVGAERCLCLGQEQGWKCDFGYVLLSLVPTFCCLLSRLNHQGLLCAFVSG